LTGAEVEAAQEEHRNGLLGGNARSWRSIFLRSLEKGLNDPQVHALLHAPLSGYDRVTVVRSGLQAWSYPEPVKALTVTTTAAASTSVVVPPDPLADLSDEALDFIATEILRLTKPTLFMTTVDEVEADQKHV